MPAKDKEKGGKGGKDGKDGKDDKAKEEEEVKPEVVTVLQECRNNIALIEKAVQTKEPRFVTRSLRSLPSLRKRLTVDDLTQLLTKHTSGGTSELSARLLDALANCPVTDSPANEMAVDGSAGEKGGEEAPMPLTMQPSWVQPILSAAAADGELYLSLLIVVFLLDQKQLEAARDCCCLLVAEMTAGGTRRALDALAAKVMFYYARSHELCNRDVEIRSPLLAAYRIACLQQHEETQATILNCLLRSYIAHSQYDQADTLRSKTTDTFTDNKSNNQFARYQYYLGRIHAVQLNYSESHTCLLKALRKSPQSSAIGFRLTVTKLLVIVQMLMGEIPDRSIFRTKDLQHLLTAYLAVTNAVRVGDLSMFTATQATHLALFTADSNATLVGRLRHSVIKTGLRKINIAYSRISLTDVCAKLKLESVEDTEGIVAKAIHDGVIEATIDRSTMTLVSDPAEDLYSTLEPTGAFHKRISYCLDLHNEAVQAMRYHPDAHKKKKPSAEELQKRKDLDAEIAEALEEDEDDY